MSVDTTSNACALLSVLPSHSAFQQIIQVTAKRTNVVCVGRSTSEKQLQVNKTAEGP